MKNLFPTLLLITAVQFLFAQADSTIYGLARSSSPPATYLAQINPATGLVSNISPSSVGIGLNLSSTTIDPFAGVYYYTLSGKFRSVDMSTGAVIDSPLITFTNGTYFDGFLFNCADSMIYGLARNSSPASLYLATIDPSNGFVTNISSQSIGTSITLLGTTIDPINRIFYFVSSGKLVGVDMDSGAKVSEPVITHPNTLYFDGIHYNDADGKIYGLARSSSPGVVFLASIDPLTGVVTHLSSSSIASSITLTGTSIDPNQNVFYFVSDDEFRSVDISTGALISSPNIANTNSGIPYFGGLRYYQSGCAVLPTTPAYIYQTDSLSICNGDSILLAGAYQTTPGVYVDTIVNPGSTDVILSTTLNVLGPSLHAIGGVVSYQGQGITAGSVGLLEAGPNNTLNLVDSTTVSSTGTYLFDSLANGVYLIVAIGDPSLYSSIPTYSLSSDTWQLADSAILQSNCPDTLSMDVALIDIIPAAIGTGTITGQIGQRLSASTFVPMSGITVTLRNAIDNMPVMMAHADESGLFTFSQIANGSYRIFVDHPGFEMDSSNQFILSDSLTSYSTEVCMDNLAQSIAVCSQRITTSAEGPLPLRGIRIAPNPFREGFQLNWDREPQKANYEIRDVRGRIIQSGPLSAVSSQFISVADAPKGLYLLSVQAGNRRAVMKLMKE